MTNLKRLVPAPLSSVTLVILWLILARSSGIGQVMLALALGIAVPLVTSRLRMTGVRLRRPLIAARYVGAVIRDVLASGWQVALGVVAWRGRRPQSRFVIVPLELRAPVGLAVLSMVTTVVPGTVWSELALDRTTLLLHVWDVTDEGVFIAHYKARYEQPLREIFE